MCAKIKLKPRGTIKLGSRKKTKTLGTGDGGFITSSIRKMKNGKKD
jgi:hypothetical protein